jgi:SAM-dependent methyltransferase
VASEAETRIHFGAEVAPHYDANSRDMFRPEVLDPTVDFLAELSGDGAALEFGVGTGRVALPLSERGVRVHGIDNSDPMLDQLRAKPGAERIGLTCADFATARVDDSFQLAYLIFNTITNLTTQEAQVACFQNAADHLAPGGHFVIECYVPELRRVPPGERIRPMDMSPDHVGFDEFKDFVGQIQVSHHYWNAGGKMRTHAAPFRWVWPSELDLMARLAGMTLRERWAGWDRAPFEDDSRSHVSVWQKQG